MKDQKLDDSVAQLRGNIYYEQIIASLRELDAALQDELVQSKDPNDVLRAQGAVRMTRFLLKELAP